jgi:Mn2+/Fe2+ NRAMP family transporter
MPWMIFYQQSAVLDKGLTANDLKVARWETAIGAVVTQLIMASVLIAVAATIGRTNPHTPLNDVPRSDMPSFPSSAAQLAALCLQPA